LGIIEIAVINTVGRHTLNKLLEKENKAMNNQRGLRQVICSIFVLLTFVACDALKPGSPSAPVPSTTSESPINYGYAKSAKKTIVPLAIVAPENGLKISMHDIVYQKVDDIWVLGGYQLTITSALGKVTEIQFSDFKYGKYLSATGYSVLENGKSISGPSYESFDAANVKNGMGFYPNGDNPALFLALPCSIASSNEETSQEKSLGDIWMTHVSNHTVTCTSGEKYVFNFEKYSYMDKPWLTMSGVTLALNVSDPGKTSKVTSIVPTSTIITPIPASTAEPSPSTDQGIPVVQSVVLRRDTSTGALVIYQDIYFKDSDGDVFRVDYDVVSTSNPDVHIEGGTLDISREEQKVGTFFTGEWGCGDGNYNVTLSVTLTDSAGHLSMPYEYTLNCDAGN
jgi:hypothetical protein